MDGWMRRRDVKRCWMRPRRENQETDPPMASQGEITGRFSTDMIITEVVIESLKG